MIEAIAHFIWTCILWVFGLVLLLGVLIIIGFKTGVLYDPTPSVHITPEEAQQITQITDVQMITREAVRQQRIEDARKARLAAETMQDREPVKR